MGKLTAISSRRTALILANPFPPNGRVGGSLRTVKFIKYLEPAGWRSVVLTPGLGGAVYPGPQSAASLLQELPADCEIFHRRAFLRLPGGLLGRRTSGDFHSSGGNGSPRSQARHRLLQAGKNWLIPDEEILWVLSALPLGLRLIRDRGIDLIYAVVPQFSTAILGYWLSRKSGLPFILDVKDDWLEFSSRTGKPALALYLEQLLESLVARQATRLVFTNPDALESFSCRQPGIPSQHLMQIPNGVDLAEVRAAETIQTMEMGGKFLIVSGAGGLNRRYRDIQPFLTGLAVWCESFHQAAAEVRILFLGSDVNQDYGPFIQARGLKEVIRCQPVLPRREYLGILKSAHLLLLVQMDNAPSSISGTLYEYGAVGRAPVLLVGGTGATRSFLLEHNLGEAIPADQTGKIAQCLQSHYEAWKRGKPRKLQGGAGLERFDRQRQARQLGALFDSCLDRSPGRLG
jgi:hypothetical protein